MDIYQVLISDPTSSRLIALKGKGKELWAYSISGGKTASPLGAYRAQAWKAFQEGASGFGFWTYADAGPSGTAWDDFDGKQSDFSVIYEDDNGPLSSKRWEARREAVEDYELLAMAKQKLRSNKEGAEFDVKISSVINNAEDYRQLEMTRRFLLSVASR